MRRGVALFAGWWLSVGLVACDGPEADSQGSPPTAEDLGAAGSVDLAVPPPPARLPVGDGQRVDPAGGSRVHVQPFAPLVPDGAVALGDCNADGRLDLVVAASPPLVLTQGKAGAFTAQALAYRFDDHDPAVGVVGGLERVALADMDGDGALDLLAAPGGLLGFKVVLLRGHGDCTFDPPRAITPAVSGFAVDVNAADLDLDGLLDVAVSFSLEADRPVAMFIARGDGSYAPATVPITPTPVTGSSADLAKNGFVAFSTFLDDVDRDGQSDLFMLLDHHQGWFSWGAAATGADPAVAFTRDDGLSTQASIGSAMSVSPIDFDRDGAMDYWLSGGYHSTVLLWGQGGRSFIDVGQVDGLGPPVPGSQEWGTYAFDADLDGWLDVLSVRKLDMMPEPPTPHALYLNRHDGTFVDVGTAAFDSQLPVQELSCGDLAGDSHVTCFARSPSPLVRMDVEVAPRGGWVGLRLRGTVSSPHGDGARVSLDGASRPLVLVAGPQSPTHGAHSRDLLVPVGHATSASFTIEWPSGIVQHVADLPASRYSTVTEPEVITISSRSAAADGTTVIDVAVDAKRAGAQTVTIERDGVGTFVGGAALGVDGLVHRGLQAPATPGAARITVTLDGTPLHVRPRVTFQ